MQEQANKRPRICEVLGGKDNPLEVGDPFKIEGYNGEYHINDDGVLKWGGQTSDDAIYEAINHPDRIIRKPRFTPEEVADAKALMRILGATGIERTAYGGNLCAVIGETAKVVIDQGLFPSLRPGQAISLSAITGDTP